MTLMPQTAPSVPLQLSCPVGIEASATPTPHPGGANAERVWGCPLGRGRRWALHSGDCT